MLRLKYDYRPVSFTGRIKYTHISDNFGNKILWKMQFEVVEPKRRFWDRPKPFWVEDNMLIESPNKTEVITSCSTI